MSQTAAIDKFKPSTREVIERAKQSVRKYKHTHITPEHILLGMIELNDATVLDVLKMGKATPQQIKQLVEHHLRPGEYEVSDEQLTFSERAKRVIETAKEECVRGQKTQIGPEHLLIGLLRVRNTVASAVLAAIDLTTEQMRTVAG